MGYVSYFDHIAQRLKNKEQLTEEEIKELWRYGESLEQYFGTIDQQEGELKETEEVLKNTPQYYG